MSENKYMIYPKPTQEELKICMDGWIKDLTYGTMSLKNVKVAFDSKHLNNEQKNTIKQSIHRMKEVLRDLLCSYPEIDSE